MDRTKNTLSDLNDYLFMAIEKLSDDDLSDEEITRECNRAKAIQGLAHAVIDNARLVLDAKKLDIEEGEHVAPRILLGNE